MKRGQLRAGFCLANTLTGILCKSWHNVTEEHTGSISHSLYTILWMLSHLSFYQHVRMSMKSVRVFVHHCGKLTQQAPLANAWNSLGKKIEHLGGILAVSDNLESLLLDSQHASEALSNAAALHALEICSNPSRGHRVSSATSAGDGAPATTGIDGLGIIEVASNVGRVLKRSGKLRIRGGLGDANVPLRFL